MYRHKNNLILVMYEREGLEKWGVVIEFRSLYHNITGKRPYRKLSFFESVSISA